MNSSNQDKKAVDLIKFEVGSANSFGFLAPSITSLVGVTKAPSRAHVPEAEDLLRLAAKLHRTRDTRRDFLSPDLFSEPGWEMLLALYRADAAGHRITISNLCYASNAPDTTALRWIEKLVELRLVSRKDNPFDARSTFVELEPEARSAIHAYLMNSWSTFYGEEAP